MGCLPGRRGEQTQEVEPAHRYLPGQVVQADTVVEMGPHVRGDRVHLPGTEGTGLGGSAVRRRKEVCR